MSLSSWLNQNRFDPNYASIFEKHGILTLEDAYWLFSKPSYAEDARNVIGLLGDRIKMHRLLDKDVGGLSSSIVTYPLSGNMRLPIYWDIENLIQRKGEVREFVNKMIRKLITTRIIKDKCNISLHVVASGTAISNYGNELKSFGTHFHTVFAKKEAADREIFSLIREKITETKVPAVLIVTSDGDFVEMMRDIRQAERDVFLIHRCQETHYSHLQHLTTFTKRAWHFKDIWEVDLNDPSFPTQQFVTPPVSGNAPFSSSHLIGGAGSCGFAGMGTGALAMGGGWPISDVNIPSCDYQQEANLQSLKTKEDVVVFLDGKPNLLTYCEVMEFGYKNYDMMSKMLDEWANKGITFPDEAFAAFYLYRLNETQSGGNTFCLSFNSVDENLMGKCTSTCNDVHRCLYCNEKGHGWYQSEQCPGYSQFLVQMASLGFTDESFNKIIEVYCGDIACVGKDAAAQMQAEEGVVDLDKLIVGPPCVDSPSKTAAQAKEDAQPSASEGAKKQSAKDVLMNDKVAKIYNPTKKTAAFDPSVELPQYRNDLIKFLGTSRSLLNYIKCIGDVWASSKKSALARACLAEWSANNVPITSAHFAAYFVSKGKRHCCKQNGPGDRNGVGYGPCNHEIRTGSPCEFYHECLLCEGEDHGWFDFEKCPLRAELNEAVKRLSISTAQINDLFAAYAREGQKATMTKASELPKPLETVAVKPKLVLTAKGVDEFFQQNSELKAFAQIMKACTKDEAVSHRAQLEANRFATHLHHDDLYFFSASLYRLRTSPKRFCFNFNNSVICKGVCNYEHLCYLCEEKGHGYDDCPLHAKVYQKIKDLNIKETEFDEMVEILRQ